MSFQDCGVNFYGSPKGVFNSGQKITGAFYIRQPEPKEIQGLYFIITGKSITNWFEIHGSDKNSKTVTYSEEESHIGIGPETFQSQYEAGEDKRLIVPSGRATFNFSFTLPQGIPSSFEGTYGKTTYKMEVVAERTNKFDKSKKFPFTVICSNDLYLNPVNHMPIKEVSLKDLSSFCSEKGTVEMIMDLPKKGYIPGQQLPIKCLIKNNSKLFISNVNFCLERTVTYFSTLYDSRDGIKTEKSKIVELTEHQVEKESETLFQVELSVPDILPSNLKEALINIQYFAKVRAIVTGMPFDLVVKTPVTIGNIPKPTVPYVPSTVDYPSYPGLSQAPGACYPGFQFQGVPPFQSPQFPPFQNSQFPQFRSMHHSPTPSAPPQDSNMEQAQNSGLPTYEEALMFAKTTKNDPGV